MKAKRIAADIPVRVHPLSNPSGRFRRSARPAVIVPLHVLEEPGLAVEYRPGNRKCS